MTAVGVACAFCFKAVAETGVIAECDLQVSSADDSYLAKEATRRCGELPANEFTFKKVFGPVDKPEQIEPLNVPWSDGEKSDGEKMERMISLWFETAHGTFAMKLVDPDQKDPDQQVLVSWQDGRRGQQSLVRMLVPKKYDVKLQAIDGARVYGVIGIKVLDSNPCPIDGDWLIDERPPDPDHGYYWPYLLVTPSSPVAGAPRIPGGRRTLLVVPNNTGSPTDDLQVMRAMATCALTSPSDIDAVEIARKLGTPMSPILVPLFPRPRLKEINSNLQLQALTRASLEDLPEKRLSHVDQQLIAMINTAREKLAAQDQPVQQRVLMAGFSAAGQFTDRFTVLHPELVLAAAVGSPGSWPVAPVAADHGAKLRYPIGIADVKELTGHSVDLAALRSVRSLYFRDHDDEKDTVRFTDNYATRDSEVIERLFGKRILARWCSAKQLYHTAGLRRAQFKIYKSRCHKDECHAVTAAIRKDIIDMFRTALGAR
jgi:hypothetical protein